MTPPGEAVAAPATGGRLAIIDGLRGVAAMLVVLFHLSEVANLRDLPVVGWLLAHGNFGVEVFFVISGFVITYSVRNATHTLPFLGRFALRRSIRLDPPYWATIAAEITLLYISLQLFPAHDVHMPTPAEVAAHLVYLQGLLGLPQILPIFWTLCYEVQFYLVLVATLVAVRSLVRAVPAIDAVLLLKVIAAASFVASIAIDAGVLPYPMSGLFVDRWYQFSLGIATLAVVSGWMPLRVLLAAWAVVAAFLVFGPASTYTVQSASSCVLTSALIVLAQHVPAITRVAASGVLQYLGRISYSLYLLHVVIGWRLVSVVLHMLPEEPGVPVRIGLFLLGIAASVIAAHLLYMLIERPSLKLAARISAAGRGSPR